MASLVGGTRVTLFLPVNDPAEQQAARLVVAAANRRFQGSTHSSMVPPGFWGYWVDPTTSIVYEDQVALVIVDLLPAHDDAALLVVLSEWKAEAFDAYAAVGSPQAEMWMTIQAVHRVV